MKIKLLLLFITLIFSCSTCLAIVQVNKNLVIKPDYVYLLSFDEKIIRFKVGDDESIIIEILSEIYKDRHEVLVKAKKIVNTNLIIWTNSKEYNFNIEITKSDLNTSNQNQILDFSSNSCIPEKNIKSIMGDLELDPPPDIKTETYSFEIDKPPMAR